MACSPGGRFSRFSSIPIPPDFSSHRVTVPTLLPCASCILTMVLAKLAVASARNSERARADVVFMHGIIEQLLAVGCSVFVVGRSLLAAGSSLLATPFRCVSLRRNSGRCGGATGAKLARRCSSAALSRAVLCFRSIQIDSDWLHGRF